MGSIRKYAVAVAVGVGILTAGARPAAAEGGSGYAAAAGWKLVHGLASIAYAPADLLTTPVAYACQMDKDGRATLGLGFGVYGGVVNTALRVREGFGEVVTFPFLADAGAARPFDFTPALGWDMLHPETGAPAPTRRNTPPARTVRPSGDGIGR